MQTKRPDLANSIEKCHVSQIYETLVEEDTSHITEVIGNFYCALSAPPHLAEHNSSERSHGDRRQICGQLTANEKSGLEQKLLHGSLSRQHLENVVAPEISHNQSCERPSISSPRAYGKGLERSTRSTYGLVCLWKGERVIPSKRVASRLSRIKTGSYPSLQPRDPDAGNNILKTNLPQVQYSAQLSKSLDPLRSAHRSGYSCQSGRQRASIEAALKDSTISEKPIERRSTRSSPLSITIRTEPMMVSNTQIRYVNPTKQGGPRLSPEHSSAPSDKACQYQSRRRSKQTLFDESLDKSHTDQKEVQLVPSLHDLASRPLLLPGSSALRTDALTAIPIFDEKDCRQNKPRRGEQFNNMSKAENGKENFDAHNKFRAAKPHVRQESCGVRASSMLKQSSWARTLRLWWSNVSEEEDQQSPKGRSVRERPSKTLRPDLDYCWTRYEKPEERRLYQMAHAKLMDTQRGLCSQILLTNFMYNYLHKVRGKSRQATMMNQKSDQLLSRRQ